MTSNGNKPLEVGKYTIRFNTTKQKFEALWLGQVVFSDKIGKVVYDWCIDQSKENANE